MNHEKCLLLCSHDYVQVPSLDNNVDYINNESFNKYLFQHFICDDCTKILIRVDENVDVNVNWINPKGGFQWSRKSVDLLLNFYKVEYLKNKCTTGSSWEAIGAELVKSGYKVTGTQCQAKIKTLLLLHTRIKFKLESVADDSDDWYYFQIVDNLFQLASKSPTQTQTCLKCGTEGGCKMGAVVEDLTQKVLTMQMETNKLSPNAESSKQLKRNNVQVKASKCNTEEFASTQILYEKRSNALNKKLSTTTQYKILDLIKEQKQLKVEISHLIERGEIINKEMAAVKQRLEI